ncbi:hypothetical protein GDO81_013603 [Engystomops pustulosus]|uniref:Uncharacterized protein n=1 Tax=Engystomops pustulosus TaxID=76066 RepID=A0AAV7B4G6_ENGPU|nr:hypothetical protein GDO81_013603 [Engystomops pustulosus]
MKILAHKKWQKHSSSAMVSFMTNDIKHHCLGCFKVVTKRLFKDFFWSGTWALAQSDDSMLDSGYWGCGHTLQLKLHCNWLRRSRAAGRSGMT